MVNIATLTTTAANFSAQLDRLLDRSASVGGAVFSDVAAILEAVRQEGDAALMHYTAMFDQLKVDHARQLFVPPAQRARALNRVAYEVRNALEQAADRIRNR